jgi:hypothetical protein
MKKPEHISFAKNLEDWVRKRFNIDPNVTYLSHITLGGNLDLKHEKICELYLRLWPEVFDGTGRDIGNWPASTLVIARIEFGETKIGHGRALLEFLVSKAEIFGYEKIALEYTHDGDDVQGFAKRLGFTHAWPHDTHPQRNWIAPVSKIAEHLGLSLTPRNLC